MKIETNLSPDLVKGLLFVGGMLLVYGLWVTLSDMNQKMKYQAVYGEQAPVTEMANTQVSYSLPIVQASNDKTLDDGQVVVSDDLIEAAFSAPMPVEEVETKKEEPKVQLSALLLATYRPQVGGLAEGGAFIGGGFWRVGDDISSMPVRDASGSVVLPRLAGIASNSVQLAIGDEQIALPFEQY
ncbi:MULTISPECIES: hypothetical protein [Ectopseudomonas]|jgi:hypothetical protein|uniref:Uncharacterized protein n=2 Tax=Ectopseudomonas TaxID=3236654 RepID=A0A1G6PMW7_9GAMM|nr:MULTISPECIES: hypothetical protein [Pseudomonas]ALN22003.1 hypothetical protein DW68_025320 [Pseudomonas mendocina S5.2]KER97947.1 hypothetical protein HN51_24360 [Pseudomonas mendocina]MBP3061844.1 hypothetical protein [Pseudomonas chengduensis]NNB75135.1 hypothetical protein [Pseudomonas chengduensis]SDC81550.1 hypothetical protein SAMN05216576_1074 [Pseudomonas chengduensis]